MAARDKEVHDKPAKNSKNISQPPLNYRKSLDKTAAERYTERLNQINIDLCPFDIPDSEWKDNVKLWPPMEFPDLWVYLIDTPGQYTKEKLKSYKSLEAYNYFHSGYVHTCLFYPVNSDVCLIKAKINPSQRLTESPHLAWVAINRKHGGVITGHCQCMAGLGETCSHIAAIFLNWKLHSDLDMRQKPGFRA